MPTKAFVITLPDEHSQQQAKILQLSASIDALNGLYRKYGELDTLERMAIMEAVNRAPYGMKRKTIAECGINFKTYYRWKKLGV